MKRVLLALGLTLNMLVAPAIAAPAKRDWSKVVNATPAGTYVLGNPKAKVKLVEYLSFTCSHCAHFTVEAMPVLKRKYIAPGRVSLELRNALRDRLDITAAMLTRCQRGARVFARTELLMAEQDGWMDRAIVFESAEQERLRTLPVPQALAAVSAASGIEKRLQADGLPPTAGRACLADRREAERLSAIAREAWQERKISGTPAFLINGRVVEGVSSWAQLEPAIDAALK